MIFVTVGTHEDQFNRLVEAIDQIKGDGRISQEVFIQTGYCTYTPKNCQFKDLISFAEMMKRMQEAETVVSHGGTGSIMLALYHGKIPIVVPRQEKYKEHIDDHQVLFCKTMEAKQKIIAVYDTQQLEPALNDYHKLTGTLNPQGSNLEENAGIFAEKLHNICLNLYGPQD